MEGTYGVERNSFPEIKANTFSFYFCEFIDLKYHPMQIKISLSNGCSFSFLFLIANQRTAQNTRIEKYKGGNSVLEN